MGALIDHIGEIGTFSQDIKMIYMCFQKTLKNQRITTNLYIYIYIYIYIQICPQICLLRGWGSLTMTFTGKFVYIWLTISSCYGSIPLTLRLIGRDGGLSTLCHSCGFACQQRVLQKFPGPGYLRSKDGVV